MLVKVSRDKNLDGRGILVVKGQMPSMASITQRQGGERRVISTPESKVKVMLIPTNEELAIARETKALVNC